MTIETINGLHRCQPKNAPKEGEIKNMVVLNMPAKGDKKAWIKIKNEMPEKGGTPYRILTVNPLDWEPDQYGNVAFNLEIEPSIQQGNNPAMDGDDPSEYGLPAMSDDGVNETRKHLMQAANLLVLCIRATNAAVAPHQPVIAQTSEQFQSDVAKLFIEASSRRTSDGVNWWSYIDRMPTTPLELDKPY